MNPHLYPLLRTRLGREPRPEEVSLAESLAEARNPERAATEAARLLQGLEAHLEAQEAPGGRSDGPERTVPADHRHEALARIVAAEAARDPEVQAFRREVLRGRLLRPERVAAWVERQAERDGQPTVWVRVPLDARGRLPRQAPDAGRSVETIEYPLDSGRAGPVPTLAGSGGAGVFRFWSRSGRVGSRPIASRGRLERLRGVASALGRSFGWPESDAVAFVLSGAIPPCPAVRWGLDSYLRLPSLSRVRLELSPRLSPARVAELYRKAREALPVGPGWLGLRGERLRSVGEEAAELAVFIDRVNDGRSWEEALKAWNAAFPEWRKPSVPAFCRAAREAFERVVGVRLEWQRKRGERQSTTSPRKRRGRRK